LDGHGGLFFCHSEERGIGKIGLRDVLYLIDNHIVVKIFLGFIQIIVGKYKFGYN
jgi:hypothetical protein